MSCSLNTVYTVISHRVVNNTGKSIAIAIAILSGISIAILFAILHYLLPANKF